jgi:thiol-disulfide isomerase/thioredoxin
MLVTGLLFALGACSTSTAPPDGATAAADTAPCPRGHGREAPDLPRVSLACLTAPETVQMSRLHGKPEVINIWASWCAPCREEMPLLERAHEQWGDRVLFLGVAVKDSRAHALAFLAGHGISYPQVFDPDGQLPIRLGLRGVPNTLFVDASGVEVDRIVGRLDDKALAEAVARVGAGAP